ncbi:DUF523 domain-containing protein [Dasania marina]|uniref:DUF523 domain-containing protein n=1 Tax=Dasania marina TaxID=471499 RepID=UPI00035FF210|nr:DUF523 domain-containing protein [Dasania marina]
MDHSKPIIGIISCLMGEAVRYDGSDKKQPQLLADISGHFQLQAYCPEMAIGLGVPREPIHLVERDGHIRCVGTATASLDVTEALQQLAQQHAQQHQQLSGYIFKRGSPSCGSRNVKLLKNRQLQRNAVGLYAQQLMANFPELPVADEDQLQLPQQHAQFIQAVYAYHRNRASP